MTPASERKAKERQAKRDAGLVRVEVWVPRGMVEAIRAAINRAIEDSYVSALVHAVCSEQMPESAETYMRNLRLPPQLDQPTTKG